MAKVRKTPKNNVILTMETVRRGDRFIGTMMLDRQEAESLMHGLGAALGYSTHMKLDNDKEPTTT